MRLRTGRFLFFPGAEFLVRIQLEDPLADDLRLFRLVVLLIKLEQFGELPDRFFPQTFTQAELGQLHRDVRIGRIQTGDFPVNLQRLFNAVGLRILLGSPEVVLNRIRGEPPFGIKVTQLHQYINPLRRQLDQFFVNRDGLE